MASPLWSHQQMPSSIWFQKHISHLRSASILGDRMPAELREVELMVKEMMRDWERYEKHQMVMSLPSVDYDEYVQKHRLWNRYYGVWGKIEGKAKASIMFSVNNV